MVAGLCLAVVLLQMVPNPAAFSPHATWIRAEALLGEPLAKTASLDVAQGWAALGRPILVLLAFTGAFLAATERSCATLIVRVLAYAGAAYALYGIAALLFDPTSLLGVERYAYVGDLTGTFVNRNTAATFFGTVMILWLVRLLRELDRRVPKSATGIRDFGAALLDAPPRALTIALGGTFLAFAALLLTRSRAGIILTLGCSFVAALLTLRGRVSSRAGALTGIGAGVVIAAFLVEFLGGAVAGRIGGQGLVDEGRLASYASSLAIIRDNPWLGTGLGSFRDIFPAYRSPDISTFGLWDRAHNTPLEIAVELGIPAGGAIVALWLLGLGRLLWGALTRRRDVDVPIAAFGIGLLGSLHALVDFSPQVPGFVVPWLVLLGCGLAQSVRTVGAEEPVPGRAAPAAAAVA